MTNRTFWNGFYPFIDYSTGGSTGGIGHNLPPKARQAFAKAVIEVGSK